MPASGMRDNTGALYNGASVGYCWSTTYRPGGSSVSFSAYILSFYDSNVNAAYSSTDSAYGLSVRCVK